MVEPAQRIDDFIDIGKNWVLATFGINENGSIFQIKGVKKRMFHHREHRGHRGNSLLWFFFSLCPLCSLWF